jgi:hypothetical protein
LKQVLLSQKAWNTAASTISAVSTNFNRRGGSNAGGGSQKKKQKVSEINIKQCVKTDWDKLFGKERFD